MTAPPVPNVEQVLATAWSLKPVPGEVTFYEADGGVAVMAGEEPLGWMPLAEFEELKRRIREKR